MEWCLSVFFFDGMQTLYLLMTCIFLILLINPFLIQYDRWSLKIFITNQFINSVEIKIWNDKFHDTQSSSFQLSVNFQKHGNFFIVMSTQKNHSFPLQSFNRSNKKISTIVFIWNKCENSKPKQFSYMQYDWHRKVFTNNNNMIFMNRIIICYHWIELNRYVIMVNGMRMWQHETQSKFKIQFSIRKCVCVYFQSFSMNSLSCFFQY